MYIAAHILCDHILRLKGIDKRTFYEIVSILNKNGEMGVDLQSQKIEVRIQIFKLCLTHL